MGEAMLEYAKPGNLEALVVYRTEKGWYADLVLRKTPIGASNVMGTPISMPHPTREEAERGADQVLVMALMGWLRHKEQRRGAPAREDMRAFKLHGYEFDIPGAVVDAAAVAWLDLDDDVPDLLEDTRHRLTVNLAKIMGGPGFDRDIWDAASRDAQLKCIANMTSLLVLGAPFHPDKTVPSIIDDYMIN